MFGLFRFLFGLFRFLFGLFRFCAVMGGSCVLVCVVVAGPVFYSVLSCGVLCSALRRRGG